MAQIGEVSHTFAAHATWTCSLVVRNRPPCAQTFSDVAASRETRGRVELRRTKRGTAVDREDWIDQFIAEILKLQPQGSRDAARSLAEDNYFPEVNPRHLARRALQQVPLSSSVAQLRRGA
jgi:hypothetical protein